MKIKNQSCRYFAPSQVIMAFLLMTMATVRADYQSTVIGDSPLAYYPLSVTVDPTGSVATDLSGNGNNGTYNGSSPQYNTVPGPSPFIPNALLFDGASDFVDLGTGSNPSLLNFSGPITMEAWAQPANSTSFGDIIGKGYDNSSGQEITIRVNGPYGADYFASSGSAQVSGGHQDTNWVHVVLANNGTTTTLYLNGALVQSTSDSGGAVNFSDTWAIGNGTSAGASRFFNGNICQVAIYNYGLSSDAVLAHYVMGKYGLMPSNAIPIITNQPVSQVSYTNGAAVFSVGILSVLPTTNQWYKNGAPLAGQTNAILILSSLQPGDATSYRVVSGNSNGSTNSVAVNLTLQGLSAYDQTIVADSPLAYYPLDGTIDSSPLAQDFSGHGNFGAYVNVDPVANGVAGPSAFIPNGVSFNNATHAFVDLTPGSQPSLLNFSGPITMEAWVEPADSTTFGDIMAKGYDANSYAETVVRVNGPYGANYYANSSSADVSGGQQNTVWTHVVVSSDGAHCNLYINGVLIQSVSDTTGSQLYSDPWAIANGTSAGNTRFFNGSICQVVLYNHGLTTNQVLQHFFMGSFGIAPSNSIPVISAQPQPDSAYGGSTATFSVGVLGTLPTTNLWFKNGNPLTGQTNKTLVLPNVQSGDAANYSVVIGNSIGKTNSASASLTILAAGDSLVWTITNNTGVWDSGSSANWVNVSNSQQVVFNTGDAVLFDDTPGVPTSVTINGTVSPSSITVSSDNNNFNISGSGNITGAGGLVKNGLSTLTITSPANLTGPVSINGGDVYAGNNCFASVSSITITNNSTLDFGGGTFSSGQPVTVSGTGFNSQGALFNSYSDYPLEVFHITMTGDTTFGGSARWDLGSGSSISGAHNLTLDWSAGSGYGEWNTVTIGTNVAGITLNNGNLGLKYMDTSFQNPGVVLTVSSGHQAIMWNGGYNGSFHIMNGSQLVVYSDGLLNGSSIVFEDGTEWDDYGGGTDEPINNAITFNGNTRIVIGNHNMVFTNLISGPGGFVSDQYDHAFVFSASNTYAGPSAIGTQVTLTGNGSITHSSPIFFGGGNPASVRLDASGRADHTLTLASGQILGGIGMINGGLTVSAGAILAPAGTNTTDGVTTGSNPTGTIMAGNDVTLNGTTVIKLNGPGTNDSVQAGGSIHYGGTLNLANISGVSLVAGNAFQVFNATNSSGSFASIVPSVPDTGLAWDLSHLSSGQIGVIAAPLVIGTTSIMTGGLVLAGSGGTNNGTYYVLSTTNLTTAITNWTVVSTNQFDASGNFNVTNPMGTGVRQQYYLLKQ